MQERLKLIITFIITLLVIFVIRNSLLVMLVLLVLWFLAFRPLSKVDYFLFFIASIFFTIMDLSVVNKGIFIFTQKDFYIIPFYEIFLWGFYFLLIKRLVAEKSSLKIDKKLYLLAISFMLCFIFILDSFILFIVTSIIMLVAILFYHEKMDFIYMGLFLVIGLIIELFGTLSGLWYYPTPELYIIPYWFLDLWIVMGLILRRLVLPILNKK